MKSSTQESVFSDQNGDSDPLDLIRSILLHEDREQVETVASTTQAEIESIEKRIDALRALLVELEQSKADAKDVVPKIQDELTQITEAVARTHRDEMAQALAPVMGEAIKTSARESPEVIVEALSPVMFGAITQAIADAMRELQQQIDGRLRRKSNSQALIERASAEIHGVSSAEYELRTALPFSVKEAFLIQHGSGLLIAHHSAESESTDSDLISAMLTAIRDFVGDAFQEDGEATELQEVQFGDESIILKSGTAAYCALVVDGVEPAGLRAKMQSFIAELHAQHGNDLRAYQGNIEAVSFLQPHLSALATQVSVAPASNAPRAKVPGIAKLFFGCGTIGMLATICFISWFVVSLWPTAVAAWQPALLTATPTLLPLATATEQATPTLIPTSLATAPAAMPTNTRISELATATATVAPTSTPLPTATIEPSPAPSETPLPTQTPAPPAAVSSATVWALSDRDVEFGEQLFLVRPGTPLYVEAVDGAWVLIRPKTDTMSGWVLSRWLLVTGDIPDSIVTPSP